jgi:hypothetical protein
MPYISRKLKKKQAHTILDNNTLTFYDVFVLSHNRIAAVGRKYKNF